MYIKLSTLKTFFFLLILCFPCITFALGYVYYQDSKHTKIWLSSSSDDANKLEYPRGILVPLNGPLTYLRDLIFPISDRDYDERGRETDPRVLGVSKFCNNILLGISATQKAWFLSNCDYDLQRPFSSSLNIPYLPSFYTGDVDLPNVTARDYVLPYVHKYLDFYTWKPENYQGGSTFNFYTQLKFSITSQHVLTDPDEGTAWGIFLYEADITNFPAITNRSKIGTLLVNLKSDRKPKTSTLFFAGWGGSLLPSPYDPSMWPVSQDVSMRFFMVDFADGSKNHYTPIRCYGDSGSAVLERANGKTFLIGLLDSLNWPTMNQYSFSIRGGRCGHASKSILYLTPNMVEDINRITQLQPNAN